MRPPDRDAALGRYATGEETAASVLARHPDAHATLALHDALTGLAQEPVDLPAWGRVAEAMLAEPADPAHLGDGRRRVTRRVRLAVAVAAAALVLLPAAAAAVAPATVRRVLLDPVAEVLSWPPFRDTQPPAPQLGSAGAPGTGDVVVSASTSILPATSPARNPSTGEETTTPHPAPTDRAASSAATATPAERPDPPNDSVPATNRESRPQPPPATVSDRPSSTTARVDQSRRDTAPPPTTMPRTREPPAATTTPPTSTSAGSDRPRIDPVGTTTTAAVCARLLPTTTPGERPDCITTTTGPTRSSTTVMVETPRRDDRRPSG